MKHGKLQCKVITDSKFLVNEGSYVIKLITMLMAHSIVPCFERLRSQFFQPIAAQKYKTMQVHKILQHGFNILKKAKCPQNEICS
jgi:hypothetical protein